MFLLANKPSTSHRSHVQGGHVHGESKAGRKEGEQDGWKSNRGESNDPVKDARYHSRHDEYQVA